MLGNTVQFDDVGPSDAELDGDSVFAAVRLGWRDAERVPSVWWVRTSI